MNRRIPEDAFQEYFAMGPERSYRALAGKYGVSKRSITHLAAREDWAVRLEKIEAEARERTDRRVAETIDEMTQRHLRIAKAIQARALDALRSLPMDKASDAVRALDIGIRQERLARGEPTDRQASVEEIITREYERWLQRALEESVEDGE